MDPTVSFVCAAGLLILLPFWNAVHAQTPLTADEARAIVASLYDALNQPAKKALLEKAASPNWQSCGANDQCAPRESVIFAIKSRGETTPDLKSEIKELKTSSVQNFRLGR